MTFPLKSPSGATPHPSLQTRPSRGYETPPEPELFHNRSRPQLDPHDKIYCITPLKSPGMSRAIVTYARKLKIVVSRDGEPAGGMFFHSGPEQNVLAEALRVADSLPVHSKLQSIGSVPTNTGASVEIKAMRGIVSFNWVLPSGESRKPFWISGDELAALRRALRDLSHSSPEET